MRSSGNLAYVLVSLLALAWGTGCGGNVCQDADDHVAECLGSEDDDDDEKEITDEECVDAAETEAECILDANCDEINTGAVYERCASGA